MRERKKSLLASFDRAAQDDAKQRKVGRKKHSGTTTLHASLFSFRGSIPTTALRPTFYLINFSSRSRFEIPTRKLGRRGLRREIEGPGRNASKKQLRSIQDVPLQKSPEFAC
uniref:Uncharacterized protein n=1 Tax=Ixodes ricinus TaxID=34613 RepID=A0A147BV03_IXORI